MNERRTDPVPPALPNPGKLSDADQPYSSGKGRIDVTGIMPEVRIDPYITEGHPGYEESGESEIIPNERQPLVPSGGTVMRETRITLPELILIAGTRAALGAGLGLLLADRFSREQRRAVGWTLFLVGALSTVPLAFEVFGGNRLTASEEWREQTATGSRSEAKERPQHAFAQT